MTTPGPIGAGYTTDSKWNWGYSINNSGTIAGYNKNYSSDAAFTYSAENGVTTIPIRKDGIGGYYWQDGRAYDINDSGVVVGVVKDGGYYNTSFIYNPDGTFTTFNKPEMGMTEAMAINNSGVIAGYSWSNYDMVKAWIYQDGAFTELGALGSFADTWLPTYATDINDSGMVTGTSQQWYDPTPDYEYDYNSAKSTHAFIWTADGGMIDLGSFAGDGGNSYGTDINSRGQVVGNSYTLDWQWHAFLWENGIMLDLNELLPENSVWQLQEALAINDRGEIVGVGTIDGVQHAYLLTPVPEPSTLLLLSAGIAGAFFIRRKR